MSDLNISYSGDGFDLPLTIKGEPSLTAGLTPATLLSMLVPDYWGNAVAPDNGIYASRLAEIMNQTLRNQTRLEIMDTIKGSLAWLVDIGAVEEITVTAEIYSPHRLHIAVRLQRPGGAVDFNYAINWDAQEVELL